MKLKLQCQQNRTAIDKSNPLAKPFIPQQNQEDMATVIEKNPVSGEIADPGVEPEVGSACPAAAKDTAVPKQSGRGETSVIRFPYGSPGVSSSAPLPLLYKQVLGIYCPVLKIP